MTNLDFIMQNITPRDVALAMRLTGHGFTSDSIFGKAWYACQKHYKNLEGYPNKSNQLVFGAVNPFIHGKYFDEKDNLIDGHPRVATYETWLAKQYNPKEWK